MGGFLIENDKISCHYSDDRVVSIYFLPIISSHQAMLWLLMGRQAVLQCPVGHHVSCFWYCLHLYSEEMGMGGDIAGLVMMIIAALMKRRQLLRPGNLLWLAFIIGVGFFCMAFNG